jgi:hypothetical protein
MTSADKLQRLLLKGQSTMRCFSAGFAVVAVLSTLLGCTSTSFAGDPPTSRKPLKQLRKIYLAVHPLGFLLAPPGHPNRQTKTWEQWPGRCELGYPRALELQRKYRQLIREAKDDEGMFFIPGDRELLDLARRHFGSRCVAVRSNPDLGSDFAKGLEEDRQRATKNRGPGWEKQPSFPPGLEWSVWRTSKAWATDSHRQLEEQGYTYDPATVEFVAFGGDWCYCCGSYPIHMGRALGLAKPIERRFDLIEPSASPMIMKATVVDQNLPMPDNIRLFIFKTANEGPTWGRYVAQFWEGMHGIMDRPHVVAVDFPPGSVTEINIFGWGVGRALGIGSQYDYRGRIQMSVGCGGHTPHRATLVMADESLSLEDFRAALLAGNASEKE